MKDGEILQYEKRGIDFLTSESMDKEDSTIYPHLK
jgi:hypothetical protein